MTTPKSRRKLLATKSKRQWRFDNPEYNVWYGMIQRCTNPAIKQFRDWGGRGISVCPQWLGSEGYPQFLKDMGSRPSRKHSLDRRDNDGNYEPDNCHWAPKEQQMRNTRNTIYISHLGKTKTSTEWASEYGIDPRTLRRRIKNGWSMEESLSIKPGTIHRRVGQNRGPVFITHNGEILSVGDWAKRVGVDEDIIRQRYRYGITGDDLFVPYSLVSDMLAKRNTDAAIRYEFLGEKRTLPEWSAILHIPLQRLYQRINRRKWSVEKAFTSSPLPRGRQSKS